MGGGGLTLTAEEKVRVVHALDDLGVHMIEAGFPSSNPKEQELFALLATEHLAVAEVVAFGMTRRRETAAAEDEGLGILAASFAPVCTIVGKASLLHVEKVVRVSREENLAMISESVAFLREAGKRVLLDAEHFFDGFALDPGYALDCLRVAADAGAERVVLCDTNGGSLPPQIRTALAVVSEALPAFPSGSTPTTTPAARSRTPSPPSNAAPPRSRGRSTGSASGRATRTSSRSSPTSS